MSALIEASQVWFSYSGSSQKVIKDLSLEIRQGEFVSIQGPSGSGKSTLLYLLAGFLRPTFGSIKVGGQDLAFLDDVETATFRNQRMGFIFQQFHLLPRKSVLENVLLSEVYPVELAHAEQEWRDRAIEILRKLGLGDKLDVPPNKLSGGQQQRVAIARALLQDPKVLFADEPTGNLDSKTGQEIFAILEDLAREGITVVLITHDEHLAKRTGRRIEMKDGEIVTDETAPESSLTSETAAKTGAPNSTWTNQFRRIMSIAWGELRRNRSRSVLTLLGIMFGVAAVSSMISLGQFTKRSVLKSYQEMGVNTFGISGYMNFQADPSPQHTAFQGFQRLSDIRTLLRVFPEIRRWSPLFGGNMGVQIIYGGKYVDSGSLYGVNESGLDLMQREIALGKNFHPLQVDQSRSVCIIGSEVQRQLFGRIPPLKEWVIIRYEDRFFRCQVIGVLKPLSSGGTDAEYKNKAVYVPDGFYIQQVTYWWDATLHSFLLEANATANVEKLSKAVVAFFQNKYGKTGFFFESTNAVMIAQMRKFLTLFTVLLVFVAALALVVGCIGVSNMMTVSVSERVSEFGVRKAVGATNRSLRLQILCESSILCAFAGGAGVVMGFLFQQTAIYAASKMFPKLHYAWEFNIWAVLLALVATFLSGYISGLSAARKVEQLSVAEVLRSE